MRVSAPMTGFTLIEILVAMFILTIVGLMTSSGLSFLARSRDRFDERQESLAAMQIAIMTLENDLLQIQGAGFRDASLPIKTVLKIEEDSLWFIRDGYFNPLTKSLMLPPDAVSYQRVGSDLIRSVRKVTRPGMAAPVESRTLLRHVTSFHVRLIRASNARQQDSHGIVITLETPESGLIRRVIPIFLGSARLQTDATHPVP